MPEERPLTPEKQLLKLIEGSGPQASLRTAAIKHRGLSIFSFSAWMGRISFLKERFKGRFKGQGAQQLDVKLINHVLGFCVFILSVYFAAIFFLSLVNLKKIPELKFKIQAGVIPLAPSDNTVLSKAVAYYLEKIRTRDIFKMGSKKVTVTTEYAFRSPSAKIIEATQDLKLVGISWSDAPDAMIEDAKALRTFFVKRGEIIRNIKVQAIFKDKVVLSYEGEEIELK